MKNISILILLLVSLHINAQLNFSKSDVVKGGFGPVKAPHAEPFLISSANGLHLVSKGRKSYKQVSFDFNLNFIDEKKFPIQLEYNVKEVFALNDKLYLVGLDDHFQLVFMEYNPDTGIPLELSKVKFDNIEGFSFNSIEKLDFEGNGVAFKLIFGNKEPITRIVMMNETLTMNLWTTKLDKPYAHHLDIEIRDTNTFVLNYTKTRNTKIVSSKVIMYRVENRRCRKVWDKETEKQEFISVFDSDPMPFLNNYNLEYYILHWDLRENMVYLTLHDDLGDEMDRFDITEELSPLHEVKGINVDPSVDVLSPNKKQLRFSFEIVQRSNNQMVTEMLSFDLINENVKFFQNGWEDFSLEFEDVLVSNNSLSYVKEGKEFHESPKKVFDDFNVPLNFLKNYIVNNELYSLFSVSNRGKLTTQIVRWQFD